MENTGDGSKSTACILDHQLSSKQNAANALRCVSAVLFSTVAQQGALSTPRLVAQRAGDTWHVTNNEATQDVR